MKEIAINQQLMPALGMGSWHLGQGYHDATEEIKTLQAGLDSGLTLIDTAEMYGHGKSESLIGKAIQGRRHQVYLVTKIYPWNANRLLMEKSCDNSLKRLGTDYIDLYLLHWRFGSLLKEAVSGFEKLKASGKIRAWGVSNFDVNDMNDLLKVENGQHCAVNQVFYNPANRGIEYDLTPWCQDHHIPVMAYSPLDGQGASLLHHPVLNDIANKYHVSAATIILAWIMRNGHTIPIPESGNTQHLKDNMQSLSLQLTDVDLAVIDHTFARPVKKVPLETR